MCIRDRSKFGQIPFLIPIIVCVSACLPKDDSDIVDITGESKPVLENKNIQNLESCSNLMKEFTLSLEEGGGSDLPAGLESGKNESNELNDLFHQVRFPDDQSENSVEKNVTLLAHNRTKLLYKLTPKRKNTDGLVERAASRKFAFAVRSQKCDIEVSFVCSTCLSKDNYQSNQDLMLQDNTVSNEIAFSFTPVKYMAEEHSKFIPADENRPGVTLMFLVNGVRADVLHVPLNILTEPQEAKSIVEESAIEINRSIDISNYVRKSENGGQPDVIVALTKNDDDRVFHIELKIPNEVLLRLDDVELKNSYEKYIANEGGRSPTLLSSETDLNTLLILSLIHI